MRGERIKITLKAGHNWPTSETPFHIEIAFRRQADGGQTLNASLAFQGIWTSIAICDFSGWGGGGGPDPLSPLWIRTCNFWFLTVYAHVYLDINLFQEQFFRQCLCPAKE